MKLPTDIHTHRLPQLPGEAIVNCYPETFAPQEGGWYSAGIHPWHVADTPSDAASLSARLEALRPLLLHPQVVAIGEAGLDGLSGASISLQETFFEHQARLSIDLGKPLIIHSVKALDKVLALKRKLAPTNPWIVHGFRGKASTAGQYLRHGFYLSFGEKYQAEALRAVPLDRLLMETDESLVPIAELYERAAAVRGLPAPEFGEAVRENIRRLFFGGGT